MNVDVIHSKEISLQSIMLNTFTFTSLLVWKDSNYALYIPSVLRLVSCLICCSDRTSAMAAWQRALLLNDRLGNSCAECWGMKSVCTLPAANSGWAARFCRNSILVLRPAIWKTQHNNLIIITKAIDRIWCAHFIQTVGSRKPGRNFTLVYLISDIGTIYLECTYDQILNLT